VAPCSLPALAPQERHGPLDVVLRRVETGAGPAYDLAVDYDRKTGSRFESPLDVSCESACSIELTSVTGGVGRIAPMRGEPQH
jgi:hypothetical protein